MTCGIYLITNKINGHMYVGQSVNIENRFSQHRRCLDIDSLAIDRAINKYGWENFKTDIICELERDEELLDEMEKYYIWKYNTYEDKSHYNLTPGGDFNPMRVPEIRQKVTGENNGMYGKRHAQESRIKMSQMQRNKNNSGILNVSCRKDGCNVYRYYDDDGNRHAISSMDIDQLKDKIISQGLPWIIINKEQANETFKQRTHKYRDKYTLWDNKYCSYNKTMMFQNDNNGYEPRRCFRYRYKSYALPIGHNLDFHTCFIINQLIEDEIR